MFTFIFHQILHSANNKIAPRASKRATNRQQISAIYSLELQDAELCVNIRSQLVRSETLKNTPCLSTDNHCYSVRMLLSCCEGERRSFQYSGAPSIATGSHAATKFMPFPRKQTVNYPFYSNGRLSDAIEIRNLTKIFSFPDIKPGMSPQFWVKNHATNLTLHWVLLFTTNTNIASYKRV